MFHVDIETDGQIDRQTDKKKLIVVLTVLPKRLETIKQYEMWMENSNSILLMFLHSGIQRQGTSNVVRPVEIYLVFSVTRQRIITWVVPDVSEEHNTLIFTLKDTSITKLHVVIPRIL